MIKIIECQPPTKLSGISAFHIYFDYKPELVDAVKSLPGPNIWLKKESCWEIPANTISQALDVLTFYDSIDLILLPAEIKEISDSRFNPLTEEEISAFRIKPFKHQIEGINFGLQEKKWLLLDNPGCGKTNQVIWLAETLKRRNQIEHCLIVAGINSLKSNWKKEIATFSTETCLVIGEKFKKDGTLSKTPLTITERVTQLNNTISEFFVIINIESLRDDKIIKAINKGPNKFDMIAVDEVHKCLATGRSSTQGENLLKLDAQYKIALSGTLLINNPINCWGPLVWTENDHSTLTNFKNQYCNWGGFGNKQIVGYKNLDLLQEEIECRSLRRTKEQLVDLPPKVITYELLDMDPIHAEFYEAIKNGVKEEADKVDLKSGNLLALTTRLRQATVCPEILTSKDITSTKVTRCLDKVLELLELDEKVVVLSYFKAPLYKLAQLLEKYKPLVCTGDQADSEVSTNIDLFQKDDEHYVLLGSLNRIATGLTLNRASYMIMLDEFWTSAMNTQAHDRIYRLNNTTPAFITILACKDTIDERVHEVAAYKQELSDFIIDNKPTERFSDILKNIIFSL